MKKVGTHYSALKIVVMVLSLCWVSCGNEPEFLHHVVPVEYKSYNNTHRVKELVGFGAADIIWIIDNSGSMGTYQQAVINNMNQFINEFLPLSAGFDWRMALLSTDVTNPPFVGMLPNDLLDYRTADPVVVFNRAVQRLGTNGSATEKSFEPLMNSTRNFPNFHRSGAALFLIIISDEVEQSTAPVADYVAQLAAFKGDIKRVVTYAVTHFPERGCRGGDSQPFLGGRFDQFLQATSGKHFTLCDPDFGRNLANIGKDIGARLERPSIYLKSRPVPGTLKVTFKQRDLPGGPLDDGGFWVYDLDLNAITFHNLDFAAGSTEDVQVNYEEFRPRPKRNP